MNTKNNTIMYPNLALYKIDSYLKKNNLTKKQFCDMSCLSKNIFYKWNNGSKPNINTLNKIKKIIPEITAEDFAIPYIEKWNNNDKFYNQIYEGDVIEILKKIPDKSIHLVVTSPPYNAGHNYENYNDTLKWKDYKEFLKKVIKEIHRILVKGGRLAINVPFAVKNKKTKEVRFLATTIANICEEIGFIEFEFITWHKGNSPDHFQGNNTAWGSWKSPSNPVFRPLGEVIMVFSKEQTKLEGNKEDIDIEAEEFKNWTKNVWYIEEEKKYNNVWFITNNQKKDTHPCPFPEELVRRLIKLYSYKGNIVLDPFNGIGTTTKVAYELNRKYIGIDISPTYCEIARKKILSLNKEMENLFIVDHSSLNNKIRNEFEFKELVNPKHIPQEPINRWFSYKESYSGLLVEKLLERYDKLDAKKILDPFMGAGSTLYKGYIRGIESYGFDVNPISKLSVDVKCANYTDKDLKELEKFLKNINSIKITSQEIPGWAPLIKYIEPEKLDVLLSLRNNIENLENKKVSHLLKLLWLDMIEKVSNYKKDGNGIKFIAKNKNINSIYEVFSSNVTRAIEDIEQKLNFQKRNTKIQSFLDSSINIKKYKNIYDIDALITSPPYANMFDYFEVYKIELWLGGFISSYNDWKKYKKMAMRNNLNASISPKDIIKTDIFADIYDKLENKVQSGEIKEKRTHIMVANYFFDMYQLLRNIWDRMSDNSIISVVVGNSAYGGVIIPTDEIISEIGEKIGYNTEEIVVARNLRTSSQQMKIIEDKEKLRESIVTLRKTG